MFNELNQELPCCILILNYNGIKHLQDCLLSELEAASVLSCPCPVIVVDNRSTEDDVTYIKKNFPSIEVVIAKANDYLFSLNDAVAERTEDIVIILNNDMRFDKNFISPLLKHFSDPDVFGVNSKVYDWEGTRLTTGKSYLEYNNFWYYKKWDFDKQELFYCLYAGGGSAAFRRGMFLELGGFDTLFRPAYYEEVDLSYRAWKRGWKVIYEPESVMYHKVGATIDDQYGNEKVTRIIYRNHILFNIKDCGNFFYPFIFLALLPVRIISNYLNGNRLYSKAIIDSIPRIPLAFYKRFLSMRQFILKDEDVIQTINNGIVKDLKS